MRSLWRAGIIEADEQVIFPAASLMTVTQPPVSRCQICHRTVAYRPGSLSEALTEHSRQAHPKALGLLLGGLRRLPGSTVTGVHCLTRAGRKTASGYKTRL